MYNHTLRACIFTALGLGTTANATTLDLYVDTKTSQVFTAPGPHRVKLGSFQQIDDAGLRPNTTRAPASASTLATTADIKKVEDKLNTRIDAATNKPSKPNEAKATIDDKGFRFETNDKAFKFSLNGRLHTDAAIYSGGDIYTYYASSPGAPYQPGDLIQNNQENTGTEIRRLRMEFAGQFYDDWKFKVQPELANGGANGTVGIRDAFVQYTGFKDYGMFTVGQSKQPYSFQQMMSSNDMLFMERSMEYEFTNRSVNRALGLRYDLAGKWWGIATGIYGDTATPQASGTTSVGDEGWGGAMRATMAPWLESDELFHVGVSGAYRAPPTNQRTLRYRFAQTAMSQFSYVDTGTMQDIRNSQFVDAEMVGAYGPLSFETEYNGTWINSSYSETSPGEQPAGNGYMQGAHFDVSYSLTGESRAAAYRADQGVIGRLKPNHNLNFDDGWGAWELKGRFAWLDLNQIADPIYAGGNELSTTFGANWYWNNWSRFMLDWTHVYSLNIGAAGVNRQWLDIPDNNPGGWDVVQARVSLAY